jgi:hypothetical protein
MSYHAEATTQKIVFPTAAIPEIEQEMRQLLGAQSSSLSVMLDRYNFQIFPSTHYEVDADGTLHGMDSFVDSEIYYEDNWSYINVYPVLHIVAKHMDRSGFIRFEGEDGDLWGFDIEDGKIYSVYGRTVWERREE